VADGEADRDWGNTMNASPLLGGPEAPLAAGPRPDSPAPPAPAAREDAAQKYFRYRGWIPVPLYASLLLLRPWPAHRVASLAAGVAVLLAGCALRLWAVRYIGKSARTRTEKTRPIIQTGPYAAIRNPLYASNLIIATGFAVGLGLGPSVPILVVLLAAHYHVVVLCEERGLVRRHGETYDAYRSLVPRWLPVRWNPGILAATPFTLGEALWRERSGILGILVGLAALAAKAWWDCRG